MIYYDFEAKCTGCGHIVHAAGPLEHALAVFTAWSNFIELLLSMGWTSSGDVHAWHWFCPRCYILKHNPNVLPED